MRARSTAVRLLTLALLSVPLTACVKKSTHRLALNDLSTARGEIAQLEAEQAQLRSDMEAEQQRRDSIESELQVALSRSERSLSDSRDEVDRLQAVLTQRGSEFEGLQRRLVALEAVEREVRERNAIYEDVIGRFRSLMDGGQLSVAIQRGRLVILLPQDVLFASGSATLGTEGQTVIRQVAEVLAAFPDRNFQVEGHTDNVPISTARFPSNWELSSARALAVVRLLIDSGVEAANVSGAAFADTQPVAENDDAESRRRNRRIEIVMLPNLDVIAETQVPGAR